VFVVLRAHFQDCGGNLVCQSYTRSVGVEDTICRPNVGGIFITLGVSWRGVVLHKAEWKKCFDKEGPIRDDRKAQTSLKYEITTE